MNSQVRFGWQAMLAVLVAGLLVGWFGIGWALWPVQWDNTDPIDLRQDQREEYLVLVASDYSVTGDASTAYRRLSSWPSLAGLDREIRQLSDFYAVQGHAATATQLKKLADGLPLPAGEIPAEEASGITVAGAFRVIVIAAAVIGLVALALLLFRRRAQPPAEDDWSDHTAELPDRYPSEPAFEEALPEFEERTPPRLSALDKVGGIVPQIFRRRSDEPASVWDFDAAYEAEGMEFDQTFTLAEPGGSYFGECGVGAAAYEAGDPDRVNALEVWLFDKSDIRTIARVLVTDRVYADSTVLEDLSARGEPLLAQPGMTFTLEGNSIAAEVEIREVMYLRGEPDSSAFGRVTLSIHARHL